MSWLRQVGGSLSSMTGQLSTLTKDILTEGAEENEDHEAELKLARSKIRELEAIVATNRAEIERLKTLNANLEMKSKTAEFQMQSLHEAHKEQLAARDRVRRERGEPEGGPSSSQRYVSHYGVKSRRHLDSDGFADVNDSPDEDFASEEGTNFSRAHASMSPPARPNGSEPAGERAASASELEVEDLRAQLRLQDEARRQELAALQEAHSLQLAASKRQLADLERCLPSEAVREALRVAQSNCSLEEIEDILRTAQPASSLHTPVLPDVSILEAEHEARLRAEEARGDLEQEVERLRRVVVEMEEERRAAQHYVSASLLEANESLSQMSDLSNVSVRSRQLEDSIRNLAGQIEVFESQLGDDEAGEASRKEEEGGTSAKEAEALQQRLLAKKEAMELLRTRKAQLRRDKRHARRRAVNGIHETAESPLPSVEEVAYRETAASPVTNNQSEGSHDLVAWTSDLTAACQALSLPSSSSPSVLLASLAEAAEVARSERDRLAQRLQAARAEHEAYSRGAMRELEALKAENERLIGDQLRAQDLAQEGLSAIGGGGGGGGSGASMADLKAVLVALQLDKEGLATQVAQLRSELGAAAMAKQEMAQAQSRLANLVAASEEAAPSEAASVDALCSRVEAELWRLREGSSRRSSGSESSVTAEAAMAALRTELAEREAALGALDEENGALRQVALEMKAELGSARQAALEWRQRAEAAAPAEAEMAALVSRHQSDLAAFQAECDAWRERATALEKEKMAEEGRRREEGARVTFLEAKLQTRGGEEEQRLSELEQRLMAEEQRLAGWKASLLEEQERLVKAKDSLTGEVEALFAERGSLAREKEAVSGDRETLGKEREAFMTERESLDKERQAISSEMETLDRERQAIFSEKETLDRERQAILSEKETLDRERQAIFSQRETLGRVEEPLIMESQTTAQQSVANEETGSNQPTSDVSSSPAMAALRMRLQQEQEERQRLGGEVSSLSRRCSELQSQLEQLRPVAASQAAADDTDMEVMGRRAIQHLSQLVRDKDSELEALRSRNDSLLQVLQAAESGGKTSLPDAEATQRLIAEKEALEGRVRAFHQDREQLVAALSQKHSESVGYHAEIQRLVALLQAERPRWMATQEEVQRLRKELGEASAGKRHSEEALTALRTTYNELRVSHLAAQELQTAQESLQPNNSISEQSSSSEVERTLRQQLERLTFESSEAQIRQSDMEAALAALRRQLSDVHLEMDCLRQQNQTLQQGDRQPLQTAPQHPEEGGGDEAEPGMRTLTELQRERDQLALALQAKQSDASRLKTEYQSMCDKEERLQGELQRLRQHLVQVEESYTNDVLVAEDREKTLRDRLTAAEQRLVVTDSAVQSASREAAGKVEDAARDLLRLRSERDAALTELSSAQDELHQQMQSVNNLQMVLEQFQREKDTMVAMETEHYLKQIALTKTEMADLKNALLEAEQQLKEQADAIDAARRISEEAEKKTARIEELEENVERRNADLTSLQKELQKLASTAENKIDKLLMKNLLISYFNTHASKRRDALKVIAGLLQCSPEELPRLGLEPEGGGWFGRWRQALKAPRVEGGLEHSFTEQFVRFLERESKPQQVIALPTDQLVADFNKLRPPTASLELPSSAPAAVSGQTATNPSGPVAPAPSGPPPVAASLPPAALLLPQSPAPLPLMASSPAHRMDSRNALLSLLSSPPT